MKLLAIDTSTEACSAALLIDSECAERYEIAPRRHAELILPMIDSLLAEAELTLAQMDVLCFGRGPGAFTGLRIAAGVAQGLAFSADLPAVSVSTLAALAQGVFNEKAYTKVLAAIDARMQEVYWGRYRCDEAGIMRVEDQELVCRPEEVSLPVDSGWFGAGTAWLAYHEALSDRLQGIVMDREAQRYPRARDVATIGAADYRAGRQVSAEQILPVYLRDNVVATR